MSERSEDSHDPSPNYHASSAKSWRTVPKMMLVGRYYWRFSTNKSFKVALCLALLQPAVHGGDCDVGDSFCKGRFGNVYSCKIRKQSPTEVRYCNFIDDWKTETPCLCEDPNPHKDCKYGDDYCKDAYGVTSKWELYEMSPKEVRKCKFIDWEADSKCRCEEALPTTTTTTPEPITGCPNPQGGRFCQWQVGRTSKCYPGPAWVPHGDPPSRSAVENQYDEVVNSWIATLAEIDKETGLGGTAVLGELKSMDGDLPPLRQGVSEQALCKAHLVRAKFYKLLGEEEKALHEYSSLCARMNGR
ncbi:hypothetical protein FOL46_006051 [Perkinsus olseni]|uniref:Uncharacterized protein n=1 Tax=Perkinsus olseni TaxID=32597 RepID=A0A7J6LN06_PEROL|nr:hypothetical protein FOL46_006051 [Perkinsus olseni]